MGLLAAIFLLVGVAHAQTTTTLLPNIGDFEHCIEEQTSCDHYFPDRIKTGPHPFAFLEPFAEDGLQVYCSDCTQTFVCQPGGAGAYARRIAGVWRCAEAAEGAGAVCVPTTCPLGEFVTGINVDCSVTCGTAPTTTSTSTTSTTGAGSTSTGASTSSTTTTTTTSTTTTSTTLPPGQACLTIEGTWALDDDLELLIPDAQVTLLQATCHCDGPCGSGRSEYVFFDRAGNQINLVGPNFVAVCSTGTAASTYVAFNTGDTDRILQPGEGLKFRTNTSPTTWDTVTLCVTWQYS